MCRTFVADLHNRRDTSSMSQIEIIQISVPCERCGTQHVRYIPGSRDPSAIKSRCRVCRHKGQFGFILAPLLLIYLPFGLVHALVATVLRIRIRIVKRSGRR